MPPHPAAAEKTRTRQIAEDVANNVYLTVAQRIVTLFLVPLFLAAVTGFFIAFMSMRDRISDAEGRDRLQQAQIVAVEGKVSTLETTTAALRLNMEVTSSSFRLTLAEQASSVTRLQAQRESDIKIGERIDEVRDDVRQLRARVDQLMTPLRRGTP